MRVLHVLAAVSPSRRSLRPFLYDSFAWAICPGLRATPSSDVCEAHPHGLSCPRLPIFAAHGAFEPVHTPVSRCTCLLHIHHGAFHNAHVSPRWRTTDMSYVLQPLLLLTRLACVLHWRAQPLTALVASHIMTLYITPTSPRERALRTVALPVSCRKHKWLTRGRFAPRAVIFCCTTQRCIFFSSFFFHVPLH